MNMIFCLENFSLLYSAKTKGFEQKRTFPVVTECILIVA
jgi:hypothetical protein